MAGESPMKKQKLNTKLESLSTHTVIVADTGDIEAIKKYKPTDATTNPSLILKAASMEQYKALVTEAVDYVKKNAPAGATQEERLALCIDRAYVNFGSEILKIVPGYVSTEVDARLSYDVENNVKRAKRIISMYEAKGISRDRVLIKLASTWEGVQSAKLLEAEGIHCNMTLLFAFEQAAVAAEAGVTLISPFVGRIMDWYKKDKGVDGFAATEDPGVQSVKRIYNYYKKHDIKTIVMGASFRNVGEILELCGVDRLTIAPKFLEALKQESGDTEAKLTVAEAKASKEDPEVVRLTEPVFRFKMAQNPMATEKLAEGIRKFAADIVKLEDMMKPMLA